MRFNIKNWQDKYLLTELDFRNLKAFQKYDAENKIRPSTKITVAGKATTAGEQGGGTPDLEQSARKTPFSMKKGAIDGSTLEKMVPELHPKSYDFYDAEVEFLQTALKSAGVHGKGNVSLKDAEKAAKSNKQNNDIVQSLASVIESVYDSDNIYPFAQAEPKEIENFIDSLSSEQVIKIKEWVDSIPTLKKEIKFKCSKGKERRKVLSGLADFFA